jgi:hypothetical protein
VPRPVSSLFSARRAGIETLAREPEARARARATVTRRLCTIAGSCTYAVEEELLDHSTAPAPASTGTPPISSPRSSPEQPGNP